MGGDYRRSIIMCSSSSSSPRWDEGRPEFLGLGDLELRKRYYTLFTTAAGLYRYFMNDLVEIEAFFHRTPMLRFVQKGKGVTSLTGEKLYEVQAIEAVRDVSAQYGLAASFFLLVADEERCGYTLFVETSGNAAFDERPVADAVDKRLIATESGIREQAEKRTPAASHVCRVCSRARPKLTRMCACEPASAKPSSSLRCCSTQRSEDAIPRARRGLTSCEFEALRVSTLRHSFQSGVPSRLGRSIGNLESVGRGRVGDAGLGMASHVRGPYVTGETLDTAEAFVAEHEASIRHSIVDVASLEAWSVARAQAIDVNPAAWCAIELAALDLIAKDAGVAVESLLGLAPLSGRFQYTAVLGDAGDHTFQAMVRQYVSRGFCDFKIKLSGDPERDAAKAAAFSTLDRPPVRIRVDANNMWQSANDAIAFLRNLRLPLFAIEEPLRANDYAAMAAIGEALDAKIIVDESLLRAEQIAKLPEPAERWLINVRVSKMEESCARLRLSKPRGLRESA